MSCITKTTPCILSPESYDKLLHVWFGDATTSDSIRVACLKEFSLAVKIRLARHGAKKRPFYRVVVADGRMPRDGRYIELVGRYNPVSDPKMIDIDLERVDAWIAQGAQPTNAVSHLIAIARGEKPEPQKQAKLSKKAAAKAADAAE